MNIDMPMQGWLFLAKGAYGTVYHNPANPGWVLKHGTNDGTRTYLEWVLWRTRINQRMKGMPDVDFLVSDGDSSLYYVGMRKYAKPDYSRFGIPVPHWPLNTAYGFPEYLSELLDAFNRETHVTANDLHSGNFMTDGKTLILTDPSSDTYKELGAPYVEVTSELDCILRNGVDDFELVG